MFQHVYDIGVPCVFACVFLLYMGIQVPKILHPQRHPHVLWFSGSPQFPAPPHTSSRREGEYFLFIQQPHSEATCSGAMQHMSGATYCHQYLLGWL